MNVLQEWYKWLYREVAEELSNNGDQLLLTDLQDA